MTPPKILKDNGTNPIIEISEERFIAMCKQIAEDAGFSDRALLAVQFKLPDGTFWSGIPEEMCLMVSNLRKES